MASASAGVRDLHRCAPALALPPPSRLSSLRPCSRTTRLQTTRVSGPLLARYRPTLRIVAQKPDIYKVAGTAVRTAKDFLDAGTNLIPEAVPRPLAQAGVAALGIFAFSYLLQSLFSIALFVLGIGGVGYYFLVYLNKDDDQGGGGSSSNGSNADLTLEEARRIMEKYK